MNVFRLIAVLVPIVGLSSGNLAAQSLQPVATVAAIEFHSDFWLNLHHFLYAAAQRLAPARDSRLDGLTAFPEGEDLTAAEQRDWDHAVDVYARGGYSARDLLFDDRMLRIKIAVGEAGGSIAKANVPEDLRDALQIAAPVYRRHGWRQHDAINRAWIGEQIRNLTQLAPAVTPRLAKLYGAAWPVTPIRADAVIVAKLGGYTSVAPEWIVVSSASPDGQGWSGTEIVFHEASHTLIDNVSDAIDAAALRAQVKAPSVLWHVVLFYCVGAATRQALAERGVDYDMYLYRTGLFDRAWPALKAPIEAALPDYVAGKASLDETMDRLVAALPR